jgi:hypothetical protein
MKRNTERKWITQKKSKVQGNEKPFVDVGQDAMTMKRQRVPWNRKRVAKAELRGQAEAGEKVHKQREIVCSSDYVVSSLENAIRRAFRVVELGL